MGRKEYKKENYKIFHTLFKTLKVVKQYLIFCSFGIIIRKLTDELIFNSIIPLSKEQELG
jgi:hypothetical protein